MLDEAASLLAQAGLSADDLSEALLPRFIAIYEHGLPVAIGGAEVYGAIALLRSVATSPGHRNRGLASEIVERLEKDLGNAGVRDIYLLTETAESYFVGKGFRAIARDLAPAAIAATTQFTELCARDAAFMHKSIGG